jgi:ribonuclease HI
VSRSDRFIWRQGDILLQKPEPPRGFFLLHTDGGILARQGQAAGEGSIGAVLHDPRGVLVGHLSEWIGWVEDHHVAEFRALIAGLQFAAGHGVGYLGAFLDSRFVVNQVSGIWDVNPRYESLCTEARALLKEFSDFQISWVPREWNTEADDQARAAFKPPGPGLSNR